MATIQINNNDLQVMIREAMERLCEGQWYEAEPLELEPLYEFARKATKQAVREAFRDSTSKNPSTTKKAGKSGFYA